MIALHVLEKHTIEDIASTFSLSIRHTKLILRRNDILMVPRYDETISAAKATAAHSRLRQLVSDRVDSKKGIVSKPKLIKEIKEKMGYDIKPHALTKLLRLELGLVWKRIRPQLAYVNSRKNI